MKLSDAGSPICSERSVSTATTLRDVMRQGMDEARAMARNQRRVGDLCLAPSRGARVGTEVRVSRDFEPKCSTHCPFPIFDVCEFVDYGRTLQLRTTASSSTCPNPGHRGRQVRMRRFLLVLAVLGALLITVRVACGRSLKIDACLDAGGRWDYALDRCDKATERGPNVPK
jgi:hypothetical protein